jgi:hypothetical protein
MAQQPDEIRLGNQRFRVGRPEAVADTS